MAKQVDATYGNALFELAMEEHKLDELYDEAQVLVNIFKENYELIKLLEHPQISKEEKKALIENTFKGRVSGDMTGLMVMVVDKEHSKWLVRILEYFIGCVKKEKNIGIADVTSAVTLSDSQKADIEKKLLDTTSYTSMEVTYNVDKSLIGGLVIRIEDRVVDSSIKNKLEKMSKALAQG